MKFSELSCCPVCGSKSYYMAVEQHDVYSFDGSFLNSEEGKDKGKCYCNYCKVYLGNKKRNYISNIIKKIVDERN